MFAVTTNRQFTERIPLAWVKGTGAKLINPIPNNKPMLRDEYFFFGILRGSGEMFKRCIEHKCIFYYADHAYLYNDEYQKHTCYRITKNWHCNYKIIDRPSDRYKMFKNDDLQEWSNQKNGHILICPPSFFIQVFDNQFNWLENTINIIKKSTDRKIVIREKPSSEKLFESVHKKYIRLNENYSNNSLDEDLKNAWCVVTYNSMVSIDALVKGIPVFTDSKMCVAYEMSNKSFDKIESPYYPDKRQEFLNHLGYSQFTIEEMASGKAYEILNN